MLIVQPDIHTPKIALERIKNLDLTVVEYAPAEGIRSYREALVDYYRQFKIGVTADQILITTGASEAILFSMLSCMDAGDEIIIPEPFYATPGLGNNEVRIAYILNVNDLHKAMDCLEEGLRVYLDKF